MGLKEVILIYWIFVLRSGNGKVYFCNGTRYNVTESQVWNCCGGKLFNMTSRYCSTNGPSSCSNSRAVSWCLNGNCIYHSWLCDGDHDCRDGSDELGCGECAEDHFVCKNKQCVHKSRVCNGDNDCGDGSDEFGCPKIGNNGACRFNQYRCKSHSCVPDTAVCNSKNDCGDCSDEQGCSTDRVVVRRQHVIGEESECRVEKVDSMRDGVQRISTRETWTVVLLCFAFRILSGT